MVACDDELFHSAEAEAVSGSGYEGVVEILDGNCVGCHTGDGAAAGLDLATDPCTELLDGRIVIPGDAAGSVLYQRITDVSLPMPPTGLMPEENAEVVRAWIDEGADCSGGSADGADGADGGTAPDGETIFNSTCTGCHGADGSGGTGPDLNAEVPGEDLEDLIDVVMNGKGGMPGVVPDADNAAAVAQYVLDTFGG